MSNNINNQEKIYNKVASTMRMESYSLNKGDEIRIKKCLSGEKSFSSTKRDLILKHSQHTINA